jgi:hypothetical protein
MKKPSNDLFELIHSLSPAEKRHFRMQARSGDLQYMQLFDQIANMKEYQERMLSEVLPTDHLAAAKRHLYQLILEDLSRTGASHTLRQIRQGIQSIHILKEKGLRRQCEKLLKRYKKKAMENDLFRQQLELLDLEKQLLGPKSGAETLEQVYEEEADCLRKLQNVNTYWRLAGQIGRLQWMYQKMQQPEQQQQLEALFQDPLLQDDQRAICLQSRIYQLRARATYYFTVGQPEQAYRENERLLELLDQSAFYRKQHPETYLLTFNNFLIDSLILQRYEALAIGLQKLSDLSSQSDFNSIKNLKARIFRQRYMLELNWYLSTENIEAGMKQVPLIEKGLAQHGKKILKPHRITLQYLLAYLLFLDGQYVRAQEWITNLLQEKEDAVQEIFQFNRILNLLVHFELGNWEHLSYLLLSTRRYFKQRRALYRTESALFRFLQKAINSPDPSASKMLKNQFREEVEAFIQNKEEARFFNYINLPLWLERGN